jgi:hypothetical protein
MSRVIGANALEELEKLLRMDDGVARGKIVSFKDDWQKV